MYNQCSPILGKFKANLSCVYLLTSYLVMMVQLVLALTSGCLHVDISTVLHAVWKSFLWWSLKDQRCILCMAMYTPTTGCGML